MPGSKSGWELHRGCPKIPWVLQTCPDAGQEQGQARGEAGRHLWGGAQHRHPMRSQTWGPHRLERLPEGGGHLKGQRRHWTPKRGVSVTLL